MQFFNCKRIQFSVLNENITSSRMLDIFFFLELNLKMVPGTPIEIT